MPTYVVLIGVPGSGKSTYIAENLSGFGVVLSADQFYDQGEMSVGEAYCLLKKAVPATLASGQNVVLDVTNAKSAYRREMVALGKPYAQMIIGIYLKVPCEVACERHRRRMLNNTSKRYPEYAEKFFSLIRRQCDDLLQEPPSLDEGFDELIVVE